MKIYTPFSQRIIILLKWKLKKWSYSFGVVRGRGSCPPLPPPPFFARSADTARPALAPLPLRGTGRAPPRGSAPASPACAGAAPAAGPGGLPGVPRLLAGQGGAQPRRRYPSAAAELRGQRGLAFPVEGKRRKNGLLRPSPPRPRPTRRRIKPAEAGRRKGGRGSCAAWGWARGVLAGDARPPAPPVNSVAKSGPGEAGSIRALMVK